MHTVLKSALAAALSGMVTGAWAVTIDAVEPATIATGKSAEITVTIAGGDAGGAQVTLSPGGPYLAATWPLAEPVLDLAFHHDRLIVAGGAAGLLMRPLDDGDDAGAFSVLSDLNSLAVRIAGDSAYVLSADREVLVFDLSRPDSPAPRQRYPLRDEVRDFAAGDGLIGVLYQDNEVVVLDTGADAGDKRTISIHPENEVSHIAVDRGVVYAATPAGVLIFDPRDETPFGAAGIFKLLDGAGVLAVRDGLLLIAGRSGGLTVIDMSDPRAPRWLASHHRVGLIRRMVVEGDDVLMLRDDGRLLLLDLALPTMPTLISSYDVGGDARAAALSTRHVAAAVSSGIAHVDFTAEPPLLSNDMLDIGQGVNFGGQRRAYVDGAIAYVADWFSGIHIYDVADNRAPRLLSSLRTPGSPKGIVVRDGIGYVADDDHGLQVLDLADPRRPRLISNLATAGLAYTPKIVGERLYLASHRGGFQIIDISAPRAPRLIGAYDTPGKAWSLDVVGDVAYVADDDAGLLVFDVRDPAHPAPIGSFVPGGHVEEVLVDGDLAYVALFDDGVYVLDVRDPANPRPLAHVATPGNARGLDLHGRKLYVADWLAGVHVVDVSTPDKPAIIASYDTDGAAWGVRIAGDSAVVLDWWGGLVTLDIADPARPALAARYPARGKIHQLSAFGDFLVAAHGSGGVQVFDIRNALNPTWVTSVELPADAVRVSVVDDVAYVALRGGGIALIDLREPFEARHIGTVEHPGSIERMQAAGQRLYVLDRSGLSIFDVQQRRDPVRSGGLPGRVNDFFADGTTLFVAMPNREILVFDTSDPGNLALKQRVQLPYEPLRLTATRDHLASADRQQITVYSRRPSSIIPGGVTVPFPDVRAIMLKGGRLFASHGTGKFHVWTMSPEGTLVPGANYTLSAAIDRFFIYRDTVYFAGGETVRAAALLPAPRVTGHEADRLRVAVSPELTTGAYDVQVTTADGAYARRHNAITVTVPRFSKPKFTLEDLEKALRARQADSVPGLP